MATRSLIRVLRLTISLVLSGIAIVAVLGISYVPVTAQQAETAVQRPRSSGPSQAQFDSLSKRAMEALDADNLQMAIPLLRKALALNPRWAEGWWSLGTSYYDQESYAEAEIAFQRVIALEPKHGTAHAFLGLCEFELGDDRAALRDIETTKDLGTLDDPQLRQVVFYHEGVLLQRAGRFIAAEKPFDSLCQGNAGGGDVARAFGMAVLRMRDKQFPATGSDASVIVPQVGRAACLAAQKNFDSARQLFASITDAYPHFPYVHYAFGRVLFDARDIPGAITEFKREIDEGHDRVLPMLQIAATDYKIDSPAGLPYAQQALALAPQLPFAHYLLGLLLADTGDDEKAIPELEYARKAFPQDARVFWSLAGAYAHVGRAQDAAKARAEVARLYQKYGRPDDGTGAGANPSQSPDAATDLTDAAEQGPKN